MKYSESSYNFFNRDNVNLDIGYRCPLECSLCGRQTSFRNKGLSVPGHDMSLENFEKVTNHFKRISFCGQYSDPIHHPQILDFLKIVENKKMVSGQMHVASSLKPYQFYIDAFKIAPNIKWTFGIDGLPADSNKYRINQDGKKLYDIMIESKKYLIQKPRWQYIVFKYNENNIYEAQQMAKNAAINFTIINSGRNFEWKKELKATEYVYEIKP